MQPVGVQLKREVFEPFRDYPPQRELAAPCTYSQLSPDRVLIMEPTAGMRATTTRCPQLIPHEGRLLKVKVAMDDDWSLRAVDLRIR
jgi:hypothetical protein